MGYSVSECSEVESGTGEVVGKVETFGDLPPQFPVDDLHKSPVATTSFNRRCRSRVCLGMIGILFTGVHKMSAVDLYSHNTSVVDSQDTCIKASGPLFSNPLRFFEVQSLLQ